MEIYRYLQRIGHHGDVNIAQETLTALSLAHQRAVPFENLDCHLLQRSILDIDLIYEKIVHRGRGGSCYELNGLFGALLRRLGFTVDYIGGRVFGRDFTGRDLDHLCLCVSIDEKKYLVDVGFGNGFHEPMELIDGATSNFGRNRYDVRLNGNRATLTSTRDGELDKGLEFSLTPRRLSDFEAMNNYHLRDPYSILSSNLVVTRTTRDGRVSLIGKRLIRRTDDLTVQTEFADDREALHALEQEFGVTIPNLPAPKSSKLTMRLKRKLIDTGRRIKGTYQRQ